MNGVPVRQFRVRCPRCGQWVEGSTASPEPLKVRALHFDDGQHGATSLPRKAKR